jgi:hypothetical protein
MAIWQYDNLATISKAEEAQGAGLKAQGMKESALDNAGSQ